MLHNRYFSQKTILITGGGTGIGRSIAQYMSSLGANVILASRKLDILELAAFEINQVTSNPVLPIACDVRVYEEIENCIQSGIKRFGRIDYLINNAAGNFISPTEMLSPKAFDTVVDIVLKGSYNCTLACGKYWIKEQIPGKIINISTNYAENGSAYVVPSSIAKAGVLNLTKSLAFEWAKYNIRINAIAPGPIPTKGAMDRLMPEPVSKLFDLKKHIPLGRYGTPEEVAYLVAFLFSEYADFITGDLITMDGGESLQGGEFNFLGKLPMETWEMLRKQKT